jgi:hypothetical protein
MRTSTRSRTNASNFCCDSHAAVDLRLFDVLAEDILIVDHIDLVAAGSGVAFTALTVGAPFIEVNDGFLDLKVG